MQRTLSYALSTRFDLNYILSCSYQVPFSLLTNLTSISG